MTRMKWFAPVAVVLLLGLVFSCTLFGPKGNLSIELTDWPLLNQQVTAVNVFVTAVEVRQTSEADDEAGWITIAEPNDVFNLLELQNGVTTTLGESEIPTGTYTELRLHVSADNTIEFLNDLNDTVQYPLKVPSGTSTGIKIKYTFIIDAGESTTITLDFNAQQSVKLDGAGTGYQFIPS